MSIELDNSAIGGTIFLKAVPLGIDLNPTTDPAPIAFVVTGDAGTIVDNGDGTATFTATAAGTSTVTASDGTIASAPFDITVAAPAPEAVASIVIEQV